MVVFKVIPDNSIEEIKQKPGSVIHACDENKPDTLPEPKITKVTDVIPDVKPVIPTEQYSSTVTNYGTWTDQFSIKLYSDAAHHVPLTNTLIGTEMYVKVESDLKIEKLQFFVRDCQYQCAKANGDGYASLDIIKVKYTTK